MSNASEQQYDPLVDDYEQWYVDNSAIFQAEVEAVKAVSPNFDNALEVGVGTGLFAEKLGTQNGLDPSAPMLEKAAQRGIKVTEGVAEELPYEDDSFDGVYFITVDCYLNLPKAFSEAKRVLKKDGAVVIGTLDWSTPVGKARRKSHADSPYYQGIDFNSAEDIKRELAAAGFTVEESRQTVFTMAGDQSNTATRHPIREGTGDGYFAAIRARVNK
ncbi:MAG TPA: class I SAM-dependent methyltransferase [Corynebacteriales bacterium]|nr:class I SAM-dependent methyltransferase [Mycobacteriales bacterium]